MNNRAALVNKPDNSKPTLPRWYVRRVVKQFLKTGRVRLFHKLPCSREEWEKGEDGYVDITQLPEWQRQLDELRGTWN